MLFSFIILLCVADGRHQVSKRESVYAVFDKNEAILLAYDEGSFKYHSFDTKQWHDAINSKGLTIAKFELDKIYKSIGETIKGGYASLTTYVKPNTVDGSTQGFIYGAWKIQVLVQDYVWNYRIAQGERHVVCKQDMQDKVTKEHKFIFRVTTDVNYRYWTDLVPCTFQIISNRIQDILGDIDKGWNQRFVGHVDL